MFTDGCGIEMNKNNQQKDVKKKLESNMHIRSGIWNLHSDLDSTWTVFHRRIPKEQISITNKFGMNLKHTLARFLKPVNYI